MQIQNDAKILKQKKKHYTQTHTHSTISLLTNIVKVLCKRYRERAACFLNFTYTQKITVSIKKKNLSNSLNNGKISFEIENECGKY